MDTISDHNNDLVYLFGWMDLPKRSLQRAVRKVDWIAAPPSASWALKKNAAGTANKERNIETKSYNVKLPSHPKRRENGVLWSRLITKRIKEPSPSRYLHSHYAQSPNALNTLCCATNQESIATIWALPGNDSTRLDLVRIDFNSWQDKTWRYGWNIIENGWGTQRLCQARPDSNRF